MSNTKIHSDKDILHHNKKSNHRRNDSGELDVFEAAGYFSGSTEYSTFTGAIVTQKGMSNNSTNEQRQATAIGGVRRMSMSNNSTNEQRQATAFGGVRRMSLDMPTKVVNQLPTRSPRIEKQIKDKKYKQPSSPGGKLASFLNSLFNQTSSKKKKSSKSTTQSMKDEEESLGGRRKRRSSISHFPSFNTSTTDPKSVFYSSSASSVSDIRTPPPSISIITTPRFNKDLRGDSDHHHHQREVDFSSKHKPENGFSEVNKKLFEKDRVWVKDEISASTENKKKKEDVISSRRVADFAFEVDEGGESDSSSDLFELQNCEFANVYSSRDLPVYETTHMKSCINRGAPISLGSL